MTEWQARVSIAFGGIFWGVFMAAGFCASWLWLAGFGFIIGYGCLIAWLDNSGSEEEQRERWLRDHPD